MLVVVVFTHAHVVTHSFKKEALDLVDALLTMDPTKRMSAKDALDHDYFWTDPMPCNPSE